MKHLIGSGPSDTNHFRLLMIDRRADNKKNRTPTLTLKSTLRLLSPRKPAVFVARYVDVRVRNLDTELDGV